MTVNGTGSLCRRGSDGRQHDHHDRDQQRRPALRERNGASSVSGGRISPRRPSVCRGPLTISNTTTTALADLFADIRGRAHDRLDRQPPSPTTYRQSGGPSMRSATLASRATWRPTERRFYGDGTIHTLTGSTVAKTHQVQQLGLFYSNRHQQNAYSVLATYTLYTPPNWSRTGTSLSVVPPRPSRTGSGTVYVKADPVNRKRAVSTGAGLRR